MGENDNYIAVFCLLLNYGQLARCIMGWYDKSAVWNFSEGNTNIAPYYSSRAMCMCGALL